MKHYLAAALFAGSSVGAFALPSLVGPVHFRLTQPHSIRGVFPSVSSPPATIQLGTVPYEFVVQRIVLDGDMCSNGAGQSIAGLAPRTLALQVGGSTVICVPHETPSSTYLTYRVRVLDLGPGVVVPANTAIALSQLNDSAADYDSGGVTLIGYIQ